MQERKFKGYIKYCYDNVPFYHESMAKAGLSPSTFENLRDLKRLPILTKEEIARKSPGGFIAPRAKVAYTRSTSGTTGLALRVAYGTVYQDIANALRMRRGWAAGVRPLDKAVWLTLDTGAGAPEKTSGGMTNSISKLYRILFGSVWAKHPVLRQKHLDLNKKNLGRAADFLMSYRPNVLHSRPSYLRRVGKLINDRRPRLQVNKVVCEGEVLSKGTRADLEGLFECEVFQGYGATELGPLGFECRAHTGVHLNADYFLFEYLRDGQEVDRGERAELVVTGLHNEAMPLIRYSLGDIVVPETAETCPCGSTLPRLRVIEGRLIDGLMLKGLQRLSPLQVIDYLESTLGLRDYQLVQVGRTELVIRLRGSDKNPMVINQLATFLQGQMGKPITLSAASWDENEMPMKYRPVVGFSE